MVKLKSVETAFRAEANQHINGAIDALGIFDNIIQPVFPFPMDNLAVILSFQDMKAPTVFEIRINAPDDSLISSGNFGVMPDVYGFGRKILNLDNFLVLERGLYTIDIYEKISEKDTRFIETQTLFMADYPPQRRMTEEDIEAIKNNPNVIKTVKTEFKPLEFVNMPEIEAVKLQLSLEKGVEIEEGYIEFPENNIIEINGKTFDLTGMKRHIEWMFGQEIPRQEEVQETSTEEISEVEDNTPIQ